VLQSLAPRLMDALLLGIGFKDQRSNKPKSPDAPNNLFAPIEGHNRVTGESTQLIRPGRAQRLGTRPLVWGALTSLAIGLLVVWQRRALRSSE
jgi:hypothetical protein